MNGTLPKNIPTVFVVFGATGDLMARKIIPALFHLFEKGMLPKLFHLIGVARREMSREEFQTYVEKLVRANPELKPKPTTLAAFVRMCSYHQGLFDVDADYKRLATTLGHIDGQWRVCANKLFHLAVPPQHYETIFQHLHSSGLTTPCGPEEGWTRVIVEKPFGKDLESAQRLDELLGRLFKEVQIYRIDHYLAKEMIQNVLLFRFSNNLFEDMWDGTLIERIELRLLENIGVEDRGGFYDSVGALRDVGQNHLLQMLALITMERPSGFTPESIRARRAAVLSALTLPERTPSTTTTYRAQYQGYRTIKGVQKDSTTETYFKIRAELSTPDFGGVPIVIEGGKRLGNAKKEIVVTFRHPTPCLCPSGSHLRNRLIFHLGPREGITIQFWAKKPGLKMEIEERTFEFLFRDKRRNIQYVEEYEKLLLDCIAGDQTLFVSTDEVRAMWKFIDPIVCAWQRNDVPLRHYKPDTNQPLTESTKLVEASNKKIPPETLRKEIGIIGLGKMGAGLALNLRDHGWRVVAFNRTSEVTRTMEKEGIIGAYDIKELVQKLRPPRVVWLMLPNGAPTDEMIFGSGGLMHLLARGDTIIEGANSYFKDTEVRYKKLSKTGIRFIDAGVSGGPGGARAGACIMVGGPEKLFKELEPLFRDLSVPKGYAHFEGPGAGHFVKMVHNGIEFGMMQALAEGFEVLKKSSYKIDVARATHIYNHGSVIESRLVGWLAKAFEVFGKDLKEVSGAAGQAGGAAGTRGPNEATWTIATAKAQKIAVKIIEGSLRARDQSQKNPNFQGKVINALRNQFGGHAVKKQK